MNVRRASRHEFFVLGEKSVAWMNRVGARATCGVDQAIYAEIAVAWRARPDRVRLVGIPYVQRGAIAFGIDRDGRNVHFAARADNAHGDLAAIGDQDLLHA